MRHRTGKCDHTQGDGGGGRAKRGEAGNRNGFERAQIDLVDKEFKVAIINIFKN